MANQEFLKKLEDMGPEKIRENLLNKKWFDVRKKTAEEWLRIQDKKKEDECNEKN